MYLLCIKNIFKGKTKKLSLDQAIFTSSQLAGRITWVSNAIFKLTCLTVLALDDNQLTTLPESINNLKSLKLLTLDDNNITSLPESVLQLSSLRDLHISNNPLNKESKMLLEQLKKDGVSVHL
ncbi:MAG: hypothetical protein GF383_14640 [Candidatus Lokiarchaeota archaeon]|nr:hypothetical protein [Candidatus Lokiarchaeota archaeon]MBD3342654.1 hypothetical protein [Candidatus Lokiarchaeota archaeon]